MKDNLIFHQNNKILFHRYKKIKHEFSIHFSLSIIATVITVYVINTEMRCFICYKAHILIKAKKMSLKFLE